MNDDIACQSLGVLCGLDGGTFAIFVAFVLACAIQYLRSEP